MPQAETHKEAAGASSDRAKLEQQIRALRQQLQRLSEATQRQAPKTPKEASEGSDGLAGEEDAAGDADGDGQEEQEGLEGLDGRSAGLERLLPVAMDVPPPSASDADAAAERYLTNTLTRFLQTPTANATTRQSLLAVLAGAREPGFPEFGGGWWSSWADRQTRPPIQRFLQGPRSIHCYQGGCSRITLLPLLGQRASLHCMGNGGHSIVVQSGLASTDGGMCMCMRGGV